jgi:hypothetical protein
MKVGLERLTGINVEGYGVLFFLVFGVDRTSAGLARVGVFKCVGGGLVVHLSVWMESTLLPPSSLMMVAVLCGLGENWIVQSLWGHGLDADGG